MLKAGGYSIITDPAARGPIEHDTFSCAHCGKVEFVRPGFHSTPQVVVIKADGSNELRDAERCPHCWEFICIKASCRARCMPKFKAVEIEEAAEIKRKIILTGI